MQSTLNTVETLFVIISTGLSLAFAPGGEWIGGLDCIALRGGGFDLRAGATIPHLSNVFAYQGMLAVITAALGATDVKSKDEAIGLDGSEHGEEG